jgi:hypothetical protein
MTQPENILINSSTSFLDKLRVELLWDHESLMIIINEIAKVRSVLNTPSFTDTELTSTLWFFSHFVKDWTTHSNFRKRNRLSNEYYELAYSIIYDVVFWYFLAQCPFEKGGLEKQLTRLNTLKQ